MNKEHAVLLIEEIAQAVMFAEADDTDSITELQSLLTSLKQDLNTINNNDALEKNNICLQLVEQILNSEKNAFDSLVLEIKNLQDIINNIKINTNHNDENTNTQTDNTGEGILVLEEWVDEAIFLEFIGNQKSVLEEIENYILKMEDGQSNAKSELRRKLHTLKGEAGVLGLVALEQAVHNTEDYLDVAKGREVIDVLLGVKDWIARAVDDYGDYKLPASGNLDIEKLRELVNHKSNNSAESIDSETAINSEEKPSIENSEDIKSDMPAEDSTIKMDWDGDTIELLGEFLAESEDGLSTADELLITIEQEGSDPEKVNAMFRVFHTIKGVAGFLEITDISKLAHTTETLLNQVRENKKVLEGNLLDTVFDSTAMMRTLLKDVRTAVENDGLLQKEFKLPALIEKLQHLIDGEYVEADTLPESTPGERLGEILTREPSMVPQNIIDTALNSQKLTGRPLGEELISTGEVEPKIVAQALRSQKISSGKNKGRKDKIKETVKIDLDRVDSLVEAIGELVIVESMVVNSPEITDLKSVRLRDYLGQLGKITRDLQDSSMRMRMVPVRGVFQKMARMVRDLSRKSGKKIKFVQFGEGTEIDRSMVEQISDPLVHMIRNSVDHGIESDPKDRIEKGKSETGEVKLAAYHEGGSIVIEITDDGRGLDKNVILNKAISKGIIKEGDTLSEQEIFKLIFAPGFSTAAQVTEISGRGVGMDVVKKNIDAMRGRVTIASETGKGTTFKLILPLTLAIIDGMLISCGSEKYILPILSIIESIQPTKAMLSTFAHKGEVINVRGDILPLYRLGSILDISDAITDPTKGMIVILEGVGTRFGLLIDEVLTQHQVVIKKMDAGIDQNEIISGAAILSDGRVGLILNVDKIPAVKINAPESNILSSSLIDTNETGVDELIN